jgi:hypothetical protein
MRIRRITLPFMACPAVPVFPPYLKNGTIFGKDVFEHKTCLSIFSTAFV